MKTAGKTKEIIIVEIKTRQVDFSRCDTDMLVIGHFSDSKKPDRICFDLCKLLEGDIGRMIQLGDFKGKEGTSAIFYTNGRIAPNRVLIMGLGEKKKATVDTVRKAAATAANKAVGMKIERLSLALHRAVEPKLDLETAARAIAEGTFLGSYRYDEYVTGTENGRLGALSVEIVEPDEQKRKKLDAGAAIGIVIGRAQSYARTIANRPGNVINPPALAEEAKILARTTPGMTCTIFDEKQMSAKGMGGILAVGSGSKTPPRFIVLKYTGNRSHAQRLPTVGLVGKAITFDSGGISIKPSANMEQMKLDKSGGIAVMATIKAAAELKLPVNIYAIIPSAENMPSGSSCRPGDIVTTLSGKTVEIQNTDAEGRMILCDAIHYAVKEDCDVIVDIATLTGSCMVALGKYMAGLMSNDEVLARQLQKAAEQSGEKVWPMPCTDEYAEEMKSKIADLKNIGSKWGGACTAAAFLRQFAGDKKWAHLDIAGMDVFEKPSDSYTEGSSGFGVRLLTTYLLNFVNRSHK